MKIYLDIDGTLIHVDRTEMYGQPTAGLEDFILALRQHEPSWLTTHCRDGNPERARSILKQHVPPHLHADIDRIKPTVWDIMKTEGINWSSDFVWLDDNISPYERARFASALPTQSFIEVNLRDNPLQLIDITADILESE